MCVCVCVGGAEGLRGMGTVLLCYPEVCMYPSLMVVLCLPPFTGYAQPFGAMFVKAWDLWWSSCISF